MFTTHIKTASRIDIAHRKASEQNERRKEHKMERKTASNLSSYQKSWGEQENLFKRAEDCAICISTLGFGISFLVKTSYSIALCDRF